MSSLHLSYVHDHFSSRHECDTFFFSFLRSACFTNLLLSPPRPSNAPSYCGALSSFSSLSLSHTPCRHVSVPRHSPSSARVRCCLSRRSTGHDLLWGRYIGHTGGSHPGCPRGYCECWGVDLRHRGQQHGALHVLYHR